MAKYAADGMVRVQVVPTIANLNAPTVAELNAGINITGFITKDGLTTPADQNNVDVATLAETFDAQVTGSWGGAIEMTGLRDNAADTLWDLITKGLQRHIVIREGVPAAGAFAAAQKVQVWPAEFHHPVPNQTGANEARRFGISAPVTAEPALKATVAA